MHLDPFEGEKYFILILNLKNVLIILTFFELNEHLKCIPGPLFTFLNIP